MHLVVTTTVRDAPLETHGFVYVVDWENKQVLKKFQPPPPVTLHGVPRGGNRGYRGVTFANENCYIANHASLFGYDADWNLVNTITSPLFSSIHEIEWDGSGIWVTSTGVDAVLKVSLDGEMMERHLLGELPEDQRSQVGIRPRQIDLKADYRNARPETGSHVAHPNGITIVDNRPYVTLYRPGAVVCLNPFELVWRNDAYYGVHSGRVLDKGRKLYMAASFQSEFRGFDLPSGEDSFQVSILNGHHAGGGWRDQVRNFLHHPMFGRVPTAFILKHSPSVVRSFLPTSRPGWSRGIAVINDDYILGGSSSATISLINTKSNRIEDQMKLEDDTHHSIFAIAIDQRGQE